MTLDPLILSRLQFAWVVAWHILLPALTVGLASYIALLEGIWFVTGQEIWFRISGFWTRIFAVAFGMGVVSGVVMPFQFGTNWSRFSDATANILSPMLAYEGLTAFTLEAGFLGVLLFGRNLVPRWAHFAAAMLVAFGTLLSTFWILVTNSWMQTPGGYQHRQRPLLSHQLDCRSSSTPPFPIASCIRWRPFMSPPALWCWAWPAYLLRRGKSARRSAGSCCR